MRLIRGNIFLLPLHIHSRDRAWHLRRQASGASSLWAGWRPLTISDRLARRCSLASISGQHRRRCMVMSRQPSLIKSRHVLSSSSLSCGRLAIVNQHPCAVSTKPLLRYSPAARAALLPSSRRSRPRISPLFRSRPSRSIVSQSILYQRRFLYPRLGPCYAGTVCWGHPKAVCCLYHVSWFKSVLRKKTVQGSVLPGVWAWKGSHETTRIVVTSHTVVAAASIGRGMCMNKQTSYRTQDVFLSGKQ